MTAPERFTFGESGELTQYDDGTWTITMRVGDTFRIDSLLDGRPDSKAALLALAADGAERARAMGARR